MPRLGFVRASPRPSALLPLLAQSRDLPRQSAKSNRGLIEGLSCMREYRAIRSMLAWQRAPPLGFVSFVPCCFSEK